MDNDNILSSLSEHIAYWYTSIKGEKDIVFPINNAIREEANQIFRDRYHEANVIISETGEIYKISKEISCQSNMWSYFYYLDDMKKNYRLKKICKEILPYSLTSDNDTKLNIIMQLKIPSKVLIIKVNPTETNQVKEIIKPYLKNLTYINSKERKIIAYPDVMAIKDNKIKILLNYYHHHHMEKHIQKIKKALSNYKEIDLNISKV